MIYCDHLNFQKTINESQTRNLNVERKGSRTVWLLDFLLWRGFQMQRIHTSWDSIVLFHEALYIQRDPKKLTFFACLRHVCEKFTPSGELQRQLC